MHDRTLGIADGTAAFRLAALQRAHGWDILRDLDWSLTAAEALAAGTDSPLLRELAGIPRSTPPVDVRELVDRVVDELGYRTPDLETAKEVMAASVCAWMLDGVWPPDDGIAVIVDSISMWWDHDASEVSDRLCRRFQGLRWEDDDVPFTAYGDCALQNEKAAEYEAWRADLTRRKLDAARAEIGGRDVGELLCDATDPF